VEQPRYGPHLYVRNAELSSLPLATDADEY
jgi:hypothetical protein